MKTRQNKMTKKVLLDILKRGDPLLATILKETERLKQLNARLSLILDEIMQGHVNVATLKNTTLTLVTDSALFATRLRYDSQNMIRKCKTVPEFCGVTQINIKVQPKTPTAERADTRVTLSPERKAWLSALIKTLQFNAKTLKK